MKLGFIGFGALLRPVLALAVCPLWGVRQPVIEFSFTKRRDPLERIASPMSVSLPASGKSSKDVADFKWYQERSADTWSEINTDHAIVYPTLGLTNEAGEFAGKVKKIFRDKGGVISEEDRDALKSELGDVLWYLTQICSLLDLELADVAEANIAKLSSRKRRGKIGGDGDSR